MRLFSHWSPKQPLFSVLVENRILRSRPSRIVNDITNSFWLSAHAMTKPPVYEDGEWTFQWRRGTSCVPKIQNSLNVWISIILLVFLQHNVRYEFVYARLPVWNCGAKWSLCVCAGKVDSSTLTGYTRMMVARGLRKYDTLFYLPHALAVLTLSAHWNACVQWNSCTRASLWLLFY